MQNSSSSDDRNVLPRWRSIRDTPRVELLSAKKYKKPLFLGNNIRAALTTKWQKAPTIENAFEVLEASLVYGADENTSLAAQQLVRKGSKTSKKIIDIATDCLQKTNVENSAQLLPQRQTFNQIKQNIRGLKKHLSLNHRDAISSIEVARLQASIGQLIPARKYADRALKIAPENRYILRSTARFFWHSNENDKALDILRNSDSLRHDPWLQASEVAFCSLMGKAPFWGTKRLRELRNSKGGLVETSELSAGLATLELENGSNKSAKKLFINSLRSPTDNSLAQYAWVKTNKELSLENEANIGKVVKDHEARMYFAYHDQQAKKILTCADKWMVDEPYSAMPAVFASNIAITVLGDSQLSLGYSESALKVNPNTLALINNKYVALLDLKKIDEAEKILPRLRAYLLDPNNELFYYAALGLLAYGKGQYQVGREWYSKALMSAQKNNSRRLVVRTFMFWLEQEAKAGLLEQADIEGIFRPLEKLVNKVKGGDMSLVMEWKATKERIIRSCIAYNLFDSNSDISEASKFLATLGNIENSI